MTTPESVTVQVFAAFTFHSDGTVKAVTVARPDVEFFTFAAMPDGSRVEWGEDQPDGVPEAISAVDAADWRALPISWEAE